MTIYNKVNEMRSTPKMRSSYKSINIRSYVAPGTGGTQKGYFPQLFTFFLYGKVWGKRGVMRSMRSSNVLKHCNTLFYCFSVIFQCVPAIKKRSGHYIDRMIYCCSQY